jgi:hypothetical protein
MRGTEFKSVTPDGDEINCYIAEIAWDKGCTMKRMDSDDPKDSYFCSNFTAGNDPDFPHLHGEDGLTFMQEQMLIDMNIILTTGKFQEQGSMDRFYLGKTTSDGSSCAF